MSRWVYRFEDADPQDVALLGGKGAGLARMTRSGLPVPPGFIITTRACVEYGATGKVPAGVTEQVRRQVGALEHETERSFGGGPLPLLVSVRSGAPVSMPGMMETILNLGIGRDAAIAFTEATGDPEFVVDVTRRLQKGFSEIVLGADPDVIDEAVADFALPADGTPFGETFDRYWARCRQALEDDVGAAVPDDPWEQLQAAVLAVLRSWTSRRALTYREHQKISHDMGTAVVVQSMVFGNLGSPSGTGVAFTRNPVTGERALYGEFLERGQGEDLVTGVADPEPIAEAAERNPEVFDELARICEDLELAYGDVLDIEYTVERGKLYLLQVRSAMRVPEAAIRIAADTLREGRVEPSAAVAGVSADHLRRAERPSFDHADLEKARAEGAVLAAGIGASPGQVTGRLVLDSDRAVEWAKAGEEVILARPTTSPRDLHGLIAAGGIVTARGGATSHAAVVARELAKPCVAGCTALSIDEERRTLTVGERVLQEGDAVSIDGDAGELLVGSVRVTRASASGEDLSLLMDRADAASGCTVLASVTTPAQAKLALERGATGVVIGVEDGAAIDVRRAARSGPGRRVVVGVYVTSPRAVMRAAERAEESEVIWVDVRALQAAMAGIPAGKILTAEIDTATYQLLEGVAAVPERGPGCRIGMRLSGPVSDDIAARLYGLGFRLFAVDPDELRVVRLALGKAAWK